MYKHVFVNTPSPWAIFHSLNPRLDSGPFLGGNWHPPKTDSPVDGNGHDPFPIWLFDIAMENPL